MSPELFNTYVDWLIKASGIFIMICLGIVLLIIFFEWVKGKLAGKKRRRIIKDEHYHELIDAANRKMQVVNRQIQSLDRCSKEIEALTRTLDRKTDSFIDTLQEKLLQYRETAGMLKDIERNIHQSVQTLQENPIMSKIEERLAEIIDANMDSFSKDLQDRLFQYRETTGLLESIGQNIRQSAVTLQGSPLATGIENLNRVLNTKSNSFVRFIKENMTEYERTANRLQRIDNNIHSSAASISESAVLLEKRDRELKDEINCLLSLEGKNEEDMDYLIRSHRRQRKNRFGLHFSYESELSFYLNYPMDIIPMPAVGKRVLKEHLECETLEDVLSVMLLRQRKGLYKIRDMGERSITALEEYFMEIGLLEIKNKTFYTSRLCISSNCVP
jgi:uncharacterized protein YukE